jgi:hypothetical protein
LSAVPRGLDLQANGLILEREKQRSISVLNGDIMEWNWKCLEGVRL